MYHIQWLLELHAYHINRMGYYRVLLQMTELRIRHQIPLFMLFCAFISGLFTVWIMIWTFCSLSLWQSAQKALYISLSQTLPCNTSSTLRGSVYVLQGTTGITSSLSACSFLHLDEWGTIGISCSLHVGMVLHSVWWANKLLQEWNSWSSGFESNAWTIQALQPLGFDDTDRQRWKLQTFLAMLN